MRQYLHILLAALALICAGYPVNAQFTYTIDSGEVTIIGYDGPGGEVVIPGTIESLPVTAIGRYAFHGNI